MANYQEARVKDEELLHKWFLTTRQTTKIRDALSNNMSAGVKLSKIQISKRIQSGGSFVSWLNNLGKKPLVNIGIPLARDNLPGLVTNLASNAINIFERKISGKGAVRAGKWFTFFISNEDMNDIIKIIKSLEVSSVLIDWVIEIVKHEIKKQEGGFLGALLAPLAASIVQPVISRVVKGISGRGVKKHEVDIWIKIFSCALFSKQYQDY